MAPHIDKFVNKTFNLFIAVCLISLDSFNEYCQTHIGYDGSDGGQWVFPFACLVEIARRVREGASIEDVVDQLLNFNIGSKGFKICLLIDSVDNVGFRVPSKSTTGVNSDWVEGGHTKGGIPEGIVKRLPVERYVIIDSKHPDHLDVAVERVLNNLFA